jgi:two-component system chemotaxis response regulator CheV
VTSLARLDANEENSRLALILDVETILREALPSRFNAGAEIAGTPAIQLPQGSVILFADDSRVARQLIEGVLGRLGVSFVSTKSGKEAWERLKAFAQEARTAGVPLRQKVAMVLTDLEMPEMDGFTLTRRIKEDDSPKALPVLIHSSLSGAANESQAKVVGADGYVAKFVPEELAREVSKALAAGSR